MSGSCSASSVSASNTARFWPARRGTIAVSRVGGAKACWSMVWAVGPKRVADACGRESVDLGDLARTGRRTTLRRASIEDLDGGDRLDVDAELDAIPRSQCPGEHAHEGDLLAARSSLDLEHRPRRRSRPVALDGGQQLGDRVQEVFDADAGQRGAEVHGQDLQLRRLLGERLAESAGTRSMPRRGSGAGSCRRWRPRPRWQPRRSVGSSRSMHGDAGSLRADAPRRCPSRGRSRRGARRPLRALVGRQRRPGRSC